MTTKTAAQRLARLATIQRRAVLRGEHQRASAAARHCTACGRSFMSPAQRAHHKANAARLCVPRA